MIKVPWRRRRLAAVVCAGLLSVPLAACTSGGGGSSGGSGEGVAYGATKEQYKQALADIDPITIKAQSPSPKGSVTGAKFEGYMKAVEEWADGKIKFDIAYSNAVAPPLEVDNALADGRLDLGSVVPSFEPQEYPANAAFGSATQQGPNGAFLGALISNTWWLDVGYNTPQMFKEAEDHGFRIIQPAFNSGLITLMCAQPRRSLADLKGQTIIVGNQAQSKAVQSFGGSPVSMAYPEIFEALQRGVAKCSLNSLLVADLGGFTKAVPHVTVDPQAGFGSGAGAWAFSKQAWEGYPLVVKQLLFDRLDAFMISNFESIWQTIAKVMGDAKSAGGTVSEFAADAEQNIAATNKQIVDSLRTNKALGDGNAWVSYMESAITKWQTKITQDLKYGDEIPYDKFPDFYKPGQTQLQPLVDAVFKEILSKHRPS
jgi:TRAP-type C4-dicarboxylate transport system substrate-binding protein